MHGWINEMKSASAPTLRWPTGRLADAGCGVKGVALLWSSVCMSKRSNLGAIFNGVTVYTAS